MSGTEYKNPVLTCDWSDPDVIRVGEDFYMVSSSFHYFPSVPVLHSKDLVHWEFVTYVTEHLQGDFSSVRPGEGAWAPSLRYHDGKFYCLVPQPDEGIFVYVSEDLKKGFRYLSCLLEGKGYEDPCPVWIEKKAYVVFAFVKSRIGFHSRLGCIEVTPDLSKRISEKYALIYDGEKEGEKQNPDIEGPKVFVFDGHVFISAPAGGVADGWQELLRGHSVYGPFETRTVLSQKDTIYNGPHQGALVSLDSSYARFAFVHFRDQSNLGRITMIEPAEYKDGWFEFGKEGKPVSEGILPLKESDESLDFSCSFRGTFSPLFQLPCDRPFSDFLKMGEEGLKISAKKIGKEESLRYFPYLLQEKISGYSQNYSVRILASQLKEGEEAGLALFGSISSGICLRKEKERYRVYSLYDDGVKRSYEYLGEAGSSVVLSLTYSYPSEVGIRYGEQGRTLRVEKEKWSGLHVGFFLLSDKEDSEGYALYSDFSVKNLYSIHR